MGLMSSVAMSPGAELLREAAGAGMASCILPEFGPGLSRSLEKLTQEVS